MESRNPYEALVAINEEINSMRDTATLLNRVMDIAMSTLQAERGFILLKHSGKPKQFEAVVARNISADSIASIQELSSSVVNQVLESGQPVFSVDARADQRFSGAESILIQNIRSVMCTPLIRGEEVIGAIYMDSRLDAGKFDEESMQFLQAFARQAAVAIENARLFEQLQSENERLRQQITLNTIFPEIIGKSPQILEILEMIQNVADSNATVLIEGESGTGKELVARALHVHSSRRDKPFIPIFCGSLSENLLESELFGHKKGAFTGAIENRPGLFEEAHGGTLFLDEIADISKNVQTKLLRVIQEGEIKRVGETKIRKVDVRIIAATNKDLWEEVEAGNFREDLYYRLNVINIKMPPLRERKGDIPILAEHFLHKFARENRKTIKGFTPGALKYLESYHWPGNIRELENAIERAVILAKGNQITEDLLQLTRPEPEAELIGKPLKEIEKYVILKTLEMTGQNRTRAAQILDVSRRWLQYRLKEWGLSDEA
ncbi:MAG: GAF domain-containing protein [Calditrichaeota bacterium]|nr:MAG: GAF domain-containing protein [Calditrichota bacterium]